MDEFLSFVTIDVWTMIMTWGNLLILFFAMKKFLFKPVKAIMDKRQEEIEKSISSAEIAKKDAENLKCEYVLKLSEAKAEADSIIKTAVKNAQLKEEEIIKDANKKAADILERADKEIENQKKAALELHTDIGLMGDTAGKCPVCGNDVIRTTSGYGCRGYKDG